MVLEVVQERVLAAVPEALLEVVLQRVPRGGRELVRRSLGGRVLVLHHRTPQGVHLHPSVALRLNKGVKMDFTMVQRAMWIVGARSVQLVKLDEPAFYPAIADLGAVLQESVRGPGRTVIRIRTAMTTMPAVWIVALRQNVSIERRRTERSAMMDRSVPRRTNVWMGAASGARPWSSRKTLTISFMRRGIQGGWGTGFRAERVADGGLGRPRRVRVVRPEATERTRRWIIPPVRPTA